IGRTELVIASLTAAPFVFPIWRWRGAVAVLLTVAAAASWSHACRRRIAGVTGDTLGAGIVMTESLVLIAFAATALTIANPDTVLWLIRHPEPELSVHGRCYGSLDVNLSPEGRGQARAIASSLAGEQFAAIYTSPLQRCTEAARVLGAGRTCAVEVVDA